MSSSLLRLDIWCLVITGLQGVLLCLPPSLTGKQQGRWLSVGFLLQVLLLLGLFIQRSLTAEFFALTNMYESVLSVVCGLSSAAFWQQRGLPSNALKGVTAGAILFNAALLLLAIFRLDASIQPLMPSLVSYWRAIHVPLVMLSYSLLMAASVGGVFQLLQPTEAESQAALDVWVARNVSLAFPLLLIGVALGAVWANEAWGSYWNWDPKENMALATLLLYGAYWHLRLHEQWPMRQLAWLLLAGFAILMLTYFGVNMLGVGLHSYGRF